MTPVQLTVEDAVGIITVDKPPVNAISQSVRQGIYDAVTAINARDDIQSVVLICEGRTFMAGADISELGKPPVPPFLNDLVDHIEASEKPIVAAIHGQALGGGLEIALGCAYRLAEQKARLGLPEVKLGLIPGAGGTQRLPRLIGAENALPMVAEGNPINAAKALDMGLIDKVSEGSLREDAIAFAKEIADADFDSRRLSLRPLAEVTDTTVFSDTRIKAAKRQRGVLAAEAAIDVVELSTQVSFKNGAAKEREWSLQLRQSPQSAALRHIFFAEREAAKTTDKHLGELPNIETIAVIGAGTMGAGIATFFALAGYPVSLLEISEDAVTAGMQRIEGNLQQSVKRGQLSGAQAQNTLALIHPTVSYDDLAETDLVIEAVFERMDIKEEIFGKLDRICKPGAILASNTSYLDVNQIAAVTSRPESVVGLHFFSPAHIMKLVEIVRTEQASAEVMAALAGLIKRSGKIGVQAGVCHGFIGNRMYQCYQREAGLLMLEGASPKQIDDALYDFGMAMGPLSVFDLSGLDISYMMRKSLPADQVHPTAFQVHDQLVEMDRKGRKTGAGFYNYANNKAEEDAFVIELIKKTAEKCRVKQRTISNEEIIKRCMTALAEEGEKILAEGIAQRASDIDVVFVNGYGFPRHRGGPMHYSETTQPSTKSRSAENPVQR